MSDELLLRDDLLDEAKFIELLSSDPFGRGIDLDYYQTAYIRDSSSLICVKKSRRIGFSWLEALTGLVRSQTVVRTTMPYVYAKYFISRNLDESKEKITLARVFYDMLPSTHRLRLVSDQKTELVFEDNYGRRSRLKALTAQPPRGPGGDVNIDEAAWIRNIREIYESALYIIGEQSSMQLTIGSSPAGNSGLFYDISSNRQNADGTIMYPGFKRYVIPWWLSRMLCRDVYTAAKEAPRMTTRERVMKYGTDKLIAVFNNTTLGNFGRESECRESDESSVFLSYELINTCTEASWSSDPNDKDAKYFFRYFDNDKDDAPTDLFWESIRNACTGIVEIGYDVGRSEDISAMVITECIGDRRYVRALLHLKRSGFTTQKAILRMAIRVIKPFALRIERNGIGMMLAEELVTEFGTTVEGIDQTNASKVWIANAISVAFQKRDIAIPSHDVLIDHLHSMQEVVEGSLIRYEADSSQHHGDIFWALGLCFYRKRHVSSGKAITRGVRVV
jgi:phage FluMu gp28-like protein